jgi:hypothetical protein
MRRKRAFKGSRLIPILAAAGIGYLLGNWNATAHHEQSPSAAQTVALRFPQDLKNVAAPARAALSASAADDDADAGAMVLGPQQIALFDPSPIIPRVAAPHSAMQLAAAEPAVRVPSPGPAPASEGSPQRAAVARPQVPPAPHVANRPGYMLDEAQIASIRQRLHLTPDQ